MKPNSKPIFTPIWLLLAAIALAIGPVNQVCDIPSAIPTIPIKPEEWQINELIVFSDYSNYQNHNFYKNNVEIKDVLKIQQKYIY